MLEVEAEVVGPEVSVPENWAWVEQPKAVVVEELAARVPMLEEGEEVPERRLEEGVEELKVLGQIPLAVEAVVREVHLMSSSAVMTTQRAYET